MGELTKWTVLRSWGPRKRAEIAGWLGNVVILPYSKAIGRKCTWLALPGKMVSSGLGENFRPSFRRNGPSGRRARSGMTSHR